MPIPEKRHRLDRELYTGIVTVSFTLCVQNKKTALLEPDIVNTFTEILTSSIEKSHCIAPVYCFMPDHLHLLLQGIYSDSNLWKTVIAYKQKTGYWLSINKPEIQWQKDFYDHIIRADEKIATHISYILDNPVRKGLVTSRQEYPYKGTIGCKLEDVLNGVI